MPANFLANSALRLCGGALISVRAYKHFALHATQADVGVWLSLPIACTGDVALIVLLHGAAFIALHHASRHAWTPDVEKGGRRFSEDDDGCERYTRDASRRIMAVSRRPGLLVNVILVLISILALALWCLGVTVILFENDSGGLPFDWTHLFVMANNLAAGLEWAPIKPSQLVRAIAPTLAGAAVIALGVACARRTTARRRCLIIASYLALGSAAQLLAPNAYQSACLVVEAVAGYRNYRRAGLFVAGGELPDDATFYGTSNIHAPLIAGFEHPVVAPRHIFHILLETASAGAFPFDPAFCIEHGCDDVEAKYLNADYMTPNYAKFASESVTASSMLSATSFSTKAYYSAVCGTMQHLEDWTSEFRRPSSLPCLPELVRSLDSSFSTAMFSAGDAMWDHFNSSLKTAMGYEHVATKPEIEASGLPCSPLADLMCADDEILPLVESWIDTQLAAGSRMMMSFVTINLHMEYYSPAQYNVSYSASPKINAYLNSLKWTDDVFGTFLAVLSKRGLLENSLIIAAGDHGDHLAPKDGDTIELGPHDAIYTIPFAMRLPNATLAMQVPPPQRPHYALDIVPTVLDALALPATVIEPYYGRSLLREQPSPDERVLFTAEAPGTTTIMLHDGPFRLARLNSGGYFCAADHERDPRQKRPVCFNVDPSTGKRKNTLEDLPAEDKARLEAWVDDRGLRTWNEHLAVNGRYWSAASAPAHERRRAAYLETTRGLLAQSAA